jgi:hypothetical protein
MVTAFTANLEVLNDILVVKDLTAPGALGPQAPRDLLFFLLDGNVFRLLKEF